MLNPTYDKNKLSQKTCLHLAHTKCDSQIKKLFHVNPSTTQCRTCTMSSYILWRHLTGCAWKRYVKTNYEHAYSNILKILQPKKENFQIKKSDIFHISAQNIDCGYSLEPPLRGGSNEYPQSMFLSRNKKNNAYPCKPQFYYIKVGFKGVKII